MGKKQHSKDRMFITSTEWKTEWGGNKDRDLRTPFKRLPFYCCGLSFTPFDDPVCTAEGHVFDILHIIPYIQKHHRNPVTGKPLEVKDLIKLQFHKNNDGEYQCPVLHKVFTEFTHIVAVKTTGNVYCFEAVRELNIKPKNWKDLLTDEPFSRNDLITLQDPNQMDKDRLLTEFDHVKKHIRLESAEAAKDDSGVNAQVSEDHKRVLASLNTDAAKDAALAGGGGGKAQQERAAALAALAAARAKAEAERKQGKEAEPKQEKAQPLSIVDAASLSVSGRSAEAARGSDAEKTMARIALRAAGDRELVTSNVRTKLANYTVGNASRSLTSTTWEPTTKNELQVIQVERNPKKKGYVRMHTSHGDLNLELHCDITPRACENFITLCEKGYYNNVVFHRNIKNFMIQGGDPTGTGTGGESIWKKPFKDEFNSKVQHSGRGILSMANSGPHTNGSQFFLLYKSAPHLNNKHTVFGTVVGGMETLARMERVPVDQSDRPIEEIKIVSTEVFVNPYTEPDEEELAEMKKKEEEAKKEAAYDEDNQKGQWYSNPMAHGMVPQKKGVGKYLKPPSGAAKKSRPLEEEDMSREREPVVKKKKELSGAQFSNFAGW